MNLEWSRYWIGLFADKTDELMTLYSPQFEFEDVNFDLRISNDLPALRRFFEGFIITDSTQSYNKFNVFDYVGDARLGSFQWTWTTKHAGDFLGVPAAGKITETRGVTVMGWNEQGKIVLERSIWDAIPVFRQLNAIPA
jgi:steroid delta-isomerase-like uncharacterized protein